MKNGWVGAAYGIQDPFAARKEGSPVVEFHYEDMADNV